MQNVIFKDLGIIDYKTAWDYQEKLLQQNVSVKSAIRNDAALAGKMDTQNYFLLCEHEPVYTLGKSGDMKNVSRFGRGEGRKFLGGKFCLLINVIVYAKFIKLCI